MSEQRKLNVESSQGHGANVSAGSFANQDPGTLNLLEVPHTYIVQDLSRLGICLMAVILRSFVCYFSLLPIAILKKFKAPLKVNDLTGQILLAPSAIDCNVNLFGNGL